MKQFFLLVMMFVCFAACAGIPEVTGRWRQPGRNASVQFYRDGTFTAVDNQGMTVNGKYFFMKRGRVRFEVKHPEGPPEIITGTCVIKGNRLILTAADGEEVDVYEKTDE